MRRLILVAALAGVAVLGLGSAFVLAGQQAVPGPGNIAICHATGSAKNPFLLETPDASGDLNGHEDHPDDIIPAIGNNPPKNMDHIYPGGWTGADILANNCEIPTGGGGITQTTTTTVTETVPVTVTVPGTTVTVPGGTTSREVTVTVAAPSVTVTLPGAATTVTVPSGAATTVTLPAQTVTLPPVTQTNPGVTVVRDAVTVTQQGATTTVTAGATATVVTVTSASSGVEGAVAVSKLVTVTVRTPRRTLKVPARVIHVAGTGMFAGRRFTVLVIRSCGCPAGTQLFNVRCTRVVRGKG
jgi:hypothetical protein